jgi:transcription initiation factor IIF auxiliary subunit
MVRKLDLRVKDTVFEPGSATDTKIAYYRSEGETTWYKVWILLEGVDLPYVASVTYRLHSTFPDPNRTVRRTVANPNCQLMIWTWGLFKIRAMVEDKNGRIHELVYDMKYDQELAQSGVKFEEVKTAA